MKAVLMHGYGGPEVLRYEDQSDLTPKAGEVLVRVAASSVNPFDYKLRAGAMKDRIPLNFPAVLGLDLSGTVEAIGKGVSAFAPGNKVFAHASQTYAELCVVKEAELARLPAGMDMELAAAIPTVTTTGAQLAALAVGDQAEGKLVLVAGAIGMVGRSAVYVAKKKGASVIAVLGPPSEASRFPKVSVKSMQVVADPGLLVELAEAVLRTDLIIPISDKFSLRDTDKAHAAAEGGAKGKVVIAV